MFPFLLVSVRPVPAWRFVLLEQFLFCTFCSVSVLFLLVSVSSDGLIYNVIGLDCDSDQCTVSTQAAVYVLNGVHVRAVCTLHGPEGRLSDLVAGNLSYLCWFFAWAAQSTQIKAVKKVKSFRDDMSHVIVKIGDVHPTTAACSTLDSAVTAHGTSGILSCVLLCTRPYYYYSCSTLIDVYTRVNELLLTCTTFIRLECVCHTLYSSTHRCTKFSRSLEFLTIPLIQHVCRSRSTSTIVLWIRGRYCACSTCTKFSMVGQPMTRPGLKS
jgi:hypothetical protein